MIMYPSEYAMRFPDTGSLNDHVSPVGPIPGYIHSGSWYPDGVVSCVCVTSQGLLTDSRVSPSVTVRARGPM